MRLLMKQLHQRHGSHACMQASTKQPSNRASRSDHQYAHARACTTKQSKRESERVCMCVCVCACVCACACASLSLSLSLSLSRRDDVQTTSSLSADLMAISRCSCSRHARSEKIGLMGSMCSAFHCGDVHAPLQLFFVRSEPPACEAQTKCHTKRQSTSSHTHTHSHTPSHSHSHSHTHTHAHTHTHTPPRLLSPACRPDVLKKEP